MSAERAKLLEIFRQPHTSLDRQRVEAAGPDLFRQAPAIGIRGLFEDQFQTLGALLMRAGSIGTGQA